MPESSEAAITLAGDLHARPAVLVRARAQTPASEAVAAIIGILAQATPVGG